MIVTDNLQQAVAAANASAVMLDGELVEPGPPIALLTNPKEGPALREVSERFG